MTPAAIEADKRNGSAADDHDPEHEGMEVVIVPDLFTSIIAAPARVNPAFERVKRAADQWIVE